VRARPENCLDRRRWFTPGAFFESLSGSRDFGAKRPTQGLTRHPETFPVRHGAGPPFLRQFRRAGTHGAALADSQPQKDSPPGDATLAARVWTLA
jgi:hypothetical protein